MVARPTAFGPPTALFVSALAASAFLLFTLELLAGRQVLPVYGGAPGVWATALCFFSGMLFVAYLYAHVSWTRLGPTRGRIVHLALAAILLGVTVLAPASVEHLRSAGLPEALNVLIALLVLAGAPAFLLASTTPLLSAWFAETRADAWWLYAASNAASLLALLAYPLVVEPSLPLSAQRALILAGLVVFVAMLAAIVVLGRRAVSERLARAPVPERPPAQTPISNRRQVWWLIAAFVPTGLLTATTNFLTTDLVSAPLLWVGPLAIYLASFVVAFSERGRRILPFVETLVPAAATLLWLPYVVPVGWPVVPLVVTVLGSFAVLAIAIHGRLAQDRPDQSGLTRFYLIVAAAGVLATTLVGVIAPILLSDIYEYPFLLVAGPAVLALLKPSMPGLLPRMASLATLLRSLVARLIPYVLVGALLILFAGSTSLGLLLLLSIGGLVVVVSATPRLLALATPVVLAVCVVALSTTPGSVLLFQGRSFFGVSQVVNEGDTNSLFSGTTLHGLQFTDARRTQPTTYYVEAGPLGDVFADLRARATAADVGMVGLGAGTIAAYSEAGDEFTFFEIDPLVISIAYDTRYFTYLGDSAVTPVTIQGDGRLSVQALAPASLDLLVLDAFSSDSVPPHLLTSEAIESYMRVLKPGAVLAFNLSNRYYDLSIAVGATARHLGLAAVRRDYVADAAAIDSHGATSSTWMVVGQPADTSRFFARGWIRVDAVAPVLTDDYPDITRVLRWNP